MKTTGLFTIHEVSIKCKIDDPFTLLPIGDIHRECELHASSHWQKCVSRIQRAPNALVLGMGDYVDGCSTSERQALSQVHETTNASLRNMYKGVIKTLANELKEAKGRTIGIIGGNHFYDIENGQTTDHLLASSLATKFLGVASLIRVKVDCGKRGNTHFDIFAHHGAGGGNTPGATFNTIEKMTGAADADFYFMGHDHKKGCVPSFPRMKLVSTKKGIVMRARTPWLGRTGSFLKCYEPGMVSYNVDAMRPACALGWIEFAITPTIVNEAGVDLIELDVRGTS